MPGSRSGLLHIVHTPTRFGFHLKRVVFSESMVSAERNRTGADCIFPSSDTKGDGFPPPGAAGDGRTHHVGPD
jgi:hypothetical protein